MCGDRVVSSTMCHNFILLPLARALGYSVDTFSSAYFPAPRGLQTTIYDTKPFWALLITPVPGRGSNFSHPQDLDLHIPTRKLHQNIASALVLCRSTANGPEHTSHNVRDCHLGMHVESPSHTQQSLRQDPQLGLSLGSWCRRRLVLGSHGDDGVLHSVE